MAILELFDGSSRLALQGTYSSSIDRGCHGVLDSNGLTLIDRIQASRGKCSTVGFQVKVYSSYLNRVHHWTASQLLLKLVNQNDSG